jgi:hypothetical protein
MSKRLVWGSALLVLALCGADARAQSASAPEPAESEQDAGPAVAGVSKDAQVDRSIPIDIAQSTPYFEDGFVADNIVRECQGLGPTLASTISRRGEPVGITINRHENFDAKKSRQALDVKIVSAVSSGNAFIGHRKSLSVRAELYREGKLVSRVTKTRNSGGGFGAGFKSSCTVLERAAEALGVDVVKWLAASSKQADAVK